MPRLHQMNVRYVALEDRLVLRIRMDDASEIQLWLTRRYTIALLAALATLAKDRMQVPKDQPAEIRSALQSFQRDAALARMDFASAYGESTAHPLGLAPLLVAKIQYRKGHEGGVVFTFSVVGGQEIQLPLNTELLLALSKILEEGARTADWGLEALSVSDLDLLERPGRQSPLH